MGRDTTVYVASGGSAKQSARQTQQSNVKHHTIDKIKEKMAATFNYRNNNRYRCWVQIKFRYPAKANATY